MAIKAALTITLHAGDTMVAKSEDAALWRRVLKAIHEQPRASVSPEIVSPNKAVAQQSRADPAAQPGCEDDPPATPTDDAVARFAADLGVATDVVRRACAPSTEPPYLHLDRGAWQAMKEATPPRGPGSVPRAAVAATLLVLWFRRVDLGSPTVKMVHRVLRTIDVRDKNAARVVREAGWLRAHGGAIALNAAKLSRAVALAKAFCARDWTAYRAG